MFTTKSETAASRRGIANEQIMALATMSMSFEPHGLQTSRLCELITHCRRGAAAARPDAGTPLHHKPDARAPPFPYPRPRTRRHRRRQRFNRLRRLKFRQDRFQGSRHKLQLSADGTWVPFDDLKGGVLLNPHSESARRGDSPPNDQAHRSHDRATDIG